MIIILNLPPFFLARWMEEEDLYYSAVFSPSFYSPFEISLYCIYNLQASFLFLFYFDIFYPNIDHCLSEVATDSSEHSQRTVGKYKVL